MSQRVFFVHGWSVQETTTYQALHLKLAQYGDFNLEEIFLATSHLTTKLKFATSLRHYKTP
ncbi:MAG: hypothetical protein KAU22_10310 [Desulfuromonadales bacterium]|nr:hypothetical protein [Desulfuromonadales bacterium]